MRLLFTRHLLVGMNEKCARCNFDLLNFESFRSKRPIELINVRVSDILRIWNDIPSIGQSGKQLFASEMV